jgi:hypothetical protein
MWRQAVKAFTISMSVLFLACGLPGGSPAAGQVQPLESPDGSAVLTVPIEPGSDGLPAWVVTLTGRSGETLYRDEASDFACTLNVYWTWDADGRVWLYNSDDGRVWFFERRGAVWTKNLWGAGTTRLTVRNLMPPAGLFPDYVSYDPDSVEQGISIDSVVMEEGSGYPLMICYVPVAFEIQEIGDSLGEWVEWSAEGFREMVQGGVGLDPEMPDYEFEIVFGQEPSPDGLVCVMADGYEYTGGAHGNSWSRSFVYDIDLGAFVEPLALVGDSAARAALCSAMADTLRARLGEEGTWIDGGTAPDPQNYNALLPLPDSSGGIGGFRMVFDPYRVAPYAYGEQEVVIHL